MTTKLDRWQKTQKGAELEEYLAAAANVKILPKSILWRALLASGRFPKRDAELDKMSRHVVLEVHDDGDLTVRWHEVRYVVATDGSVFKEVRLKG